jgi:hypothetical protein
MEYGSGMLTKLIRDRVTLLLSRNRKDVKSKVKTACRDNILMVGMKTAISSGVLQ